MLDSYTDRFWQMGMAAMAALLLSGCAVMNTGGAQSLPVPEAAATAAPGSTASITMEIRPAGKKPEMTQLQLDNGTTVQQALEKAKLVQRFRRMNGEIMRVAGDQRAKLDVKYDHTKAQVNQLYDYALHPGDQVTRKRLVNLLAQGGRYDEAYREAIVVRKAQPEDPESIAAEADLALHVGQAARADDLLEQLLRADPDDPERLLQVSGILAKHGRAGEALERTEAWAGAHPLDYRGALLVARARSDVGDTTAAVAMARRAVGMAPDSLAPHFVLGGLLQAGRRYAAAESVWVEVTRRMPGASRAWLELAFCRQAQGDVEGAVRALRDVIDREPDNAPALNFLGYLFADRNRDLEEAEASVRAAVEAVSAAFGHIDVLVNNAGISAVKLFIDMDDDLPEWHKVIDVDLHGTANMTHAVANAMRTAGRGGLIINISSVGGARCAASRELPMTGYVASKSALIHLTTSWAIEFAEHSIRVNCILPGPTHSKLDAQLTPEYEAKIAEGMLDRRYGEPLEIGALCVFMASREGAHLDGVAIPHDGGFLCIN